MANREKRQLVSDDNAFGKLVKAYREQRGWSQGDLAERWGHTRVYVSMIERGQRKLEKQEQISRLADVLEIPIEKLAEIGKAVTLSKPLPPPNPESEDLLIQALLESGQNIAKMSWLIWKGSDIAFDVKGNLQYLAHQLSNVMNSYRGQFRMPALRMLAQTYEMLGKLATENVQTKEALAHFQMMYDIAELLGDDDLIVIALVHQSEMFRRQNWREVSLRRMAAAEKYMWIHDISQYVQVMIHKASAINHFTYGDEQGFLRSIHLAQDIAENTVDALIYEIDKTEILQTKAQGYTILWQPQKALEIYKETDILRPFRPLRDQSSYLIVKAQAHCYVGDLKTGIPYALSGMEMAESLQSLRYMTRLLQMSDRLQSTLIGKERVMIELREEILATMQRLKSQ